MKKILTLCTVALMAFSSCSKEDEITLTHTPIQKYEGVVFVDENDFVAEDMPGKYYIDLNTYLEIPNPLPFNELYSTITRNGYYTDVVGVEIKNKKIVSGTHIKIHHSKSDGNVSGYIWEPGKYQFEVPENMFHFVDSYGNLRKTIVDETFSVENDYIIYKHPSRVTPGEDVVFKLHVVAFDESWLVFDYDRNNEVTTRTTWRFVEETTE